MPAVPLLAGMAASAPSAPPSAPPPAEWAEQAWLWIGFPHDPSEWGDHFDAAQGEIAAFANTVADSGQSVRLLVRDAANAQAAQSLVSTSVTLETRKYGDIWLRDTGPIVRGDGVAVRPGFNGWGGKYPMAGDAEIGAKLAQDEGLALHRPDWVLEGGAVDGDGTGQVLTTEQCLLNPNRNPVLSQSGVEKNLLNDLGFADVIWLGDGLVNDHTDGHVDNLARFIAPGRVVVPEPDGPDDPNAAIYRDAAERAEAAGLDVVRIPSPGLVRRDGRIEPASYVNFAITNALVVVPTFGCANDVAAVAAIGALFPGRRAVGLSASAVLAGGGGFHCASMQMPRIAAP